MQFTSTAKMNSLYWITSLHEQERGVTRRVWEDLEDLARQCELPVTQHAPTSASEFLGVLDAAAARAQAGMLPMIHLDTHGSTANGILIAETGEYVPWASVAEKFRRINEATGNNLCVFSGACFSFQAVEAVDINEVSPFFILLAPEHEIAAGDIEENTLGFYRDMLERSDILAAKERWFPTQLRIFHCEQMLAIVLAKYINNSGMGEQKERRKEHMVTMAVERGLAPNRRNLRAARKLAEKSIVTTEKLLERFVPTFLAGKKPGFTVAQLKSMVAEARGKGLKPEGRYA